MRQTYVLGRADAVLCLDMGHPVRIVDLTRDFVERTASSNGPVAKFLPAASLALVVLAHQFTCVSSGKKLHTAAFEIVRNYPKDFVRLRWTRLQFAFD